MKLFKIFLTLLLLIVLVPVSQVSAAGSVTVDKSSISIYKGSSSSFNIKVSNATGKVTIKSSNTSIATVDKASEWIDTEPDKNSSLKVNVKGAAVGTATITVSIDFATYDNEEIIKTYEIKVNVSNPPAPKSSNNYLKNLIVSSGEINFNKNTTAYTVVVNNDVKSINISATPEHAKASVSGTGTKSLNVYSNKFTLTVTAENGSKKYYTLNVVRKDEAGNTGPLSKDNYLSSLKIDACSINFSKETTDYTCNVDNLTTSVNITALASDTNSEVTVNNVEQLQLGENIVTIVVKSQSGEERTYTVKVIRSNEAPTVSSDNLLDAINNSTVEELMVELSKDDTISSEVLTALKNTGKILYVKVKDSTREYQIKIIGSQLENTETLGIGVEFDPNKNNIDLLTNYAQGTFIHVVDSKLIQKGIEIGISFANEYADETNIHGYDYDSENNQLSLKDQNMSIKDGYVFVTLEKQDYFVSPAILLGNNVANNTNGFNLYLIIATIEAIVIVALLLAYMVVSKRR